MIVNSNVGMWLYYRYNPIDFVRDIFKIEPYDWQKEALTQYSQYESKLAIRSGHGIGKTAFLSWISIHHLLTHFPSKVPCTAPTSHQLFDLLWAEIAKWTRKMPESLRDRFDIRSEKVELKGFERECFIVARTARREQPEAFQGFHGDNLLFIVDESSGIDDIIFEVAEGALTSPGAKIVETGNPTRNTGHFADIFKKDYGYKLSTVSSEDVPGVSQKWLNMMRTKYGEDSNVYRIRVKGLPPLSDDDSFLARDRVEEAVDKVIAPSIYYPIWGLDPARYGICKSALAKRQGNLLIEPIKFWNNKDSKQLAEVVMEEYWKTDEELRPLEICVDITGIGSGVYDRLCEFISDSKTNLNAVPVISSSASLYDADTHFNYRVDLWARARDWFNKRNVSIPAQDDFIDQLCCVGYKYTVNGKIRISTKEEIMDKGLGSPDLADSFVLTFAGTDEINEDLRYKKVHGTPRQTDIWKIRRENRKSVDTSWMAN